MSWQVIEYMEDNPQASKEAVIAHFASSFNVDEHVNVIKNEVALVQENRGKNRPLFFRKLELERKMSEEETSVDMEVMVKYPPRQGTDKDRKKYRKELLDRNSYYQTLKSEVESIKDELTHLEYELYDLQQQAKNSRKLLDIFSTYVEYIKGCFDHTPTNVSHAKGRNANIF